MLFGWLLILWWFCSFVSLLLLVYTATLKFFFEFCFRSFSSSSSSSSSFFIYIFYIPHPLMPRQIRMKWFVNVICIENVWLSRWSKATHATHKCGYHSKQKNVYDVMMVLQAWFTYYHILHGQKHFSRKQWFGFASTQQWCCMLGMLCTIWYSVVSMYLNCSAIARKHEHEHKKKQTNWNWYSIHISQYAFLPSEQKKKKKENAVYCNDHAWLGKCWINIVDANVAAMPTLFPI